MRNPHLLQLEVKVDDAFTEAVTAAEIQQATRATLAAVGREQPTELTIVVTDNASIRALNHKYLGIDAATDVLAFSQTGGVDMPHPIAATSYIGDVIVSYERVLEQAAAYEESVERELGRLVIHGVLHLLGYNDRDANDQRAMWRLQEQILDQVA